MVANSRRAWPCASAVSADRSQSNRRTLSSDATVLAPALCRRLCKLTELREGLPATAPYPLRPKRRRSKSPRAASSSCSSAGVRGRTSSAERSASFTTALKTSTFRSKGTPRFLKKAAKRAKPALAEAMRFRTSTRRWPLSWMWAPKYFTVSLGGNPVQAPEKASLADVYAPGPLKIRRHSPF